MSHEVLEGSRLNGPTAILVKDPEGHPDHVLIIDRPHLGGHHVAELRELNLAGTVGVKLKMKNFSYW